VTELNGQNKNLFADPEKTDHYMTLMAEENIPINPRTYLEFVFGNEIPENPIEELPPILVEMLQQSMRGSNATT
tara:strand:- start:364 stop:585 length:222 start_codon:yes stop_codon:yes gene_type:complete